MFYLNCFEMITRWRPTRDEIIEKKTFFLYPSQEFLSKIFSHLHISNIVLNYAFSNFYLVRTFEVDIKEQNVFKSKIFRVQKFGNFIRKRFQWFASTRRLKKNFKTWDRTGPRKNSKSQTGPYQHQQNFWRSRTDSDQAVRGSLRGVVDASWPLLNWTRG